MPRPKAKADTEEASEEEIGLPPLLTPAPAADTTFADAMRQAELAKAGGDLYHYHAWRAFAYTRPDGFYQFCVDIVGLKDLYKPFHSHVCNHATGYFPNDKNSDHNLYLYRMI